MVYTGNIGSVLVQDSEKNESLLKSILEFVARYNISFFSEQIEQKIETLKQEKVRQTKPTDTSEFEAEETNSNAITKGADMLSMFADTRISDVEFLVEDKRITAHRAILYARSSHFKQMFDSGMRESTERNIRIPSEKFATFSALLRYLYSDQVDEKLPIETLVDLFYLSDGYYLPHLTQSCEIMLTRHVTKDTVMQLLHWAKNELCMQLYHYCISYLAMIMYTQDGSLESVEEVDELTDDVKAKVINLYNFHKLAKAEEKPKNTI